MKSIDKIRELYDSWKKDTDKKYLSFSPFDAYLAGYTEGVREEEKENIEETEKCPGMNCSDCQNDQCPHWVKTR